MALEQQRSALTAKMKQSENDYYRIRASCRGGGSGSSSTGSSAAGCTLTAAGFEQRDSGSYSSRSSVESKRPCCRGCVMVCLVLLAAASAVCASVALYLDSFAGASEPREVLRKPYPRLDNAFMSIVVFNDSIPNAVGTYHKYIDVRRSVDSRTMSIRKGVLSQCERPLATPASVRFIESPWSPRTCTPDGVNTFFCPVVAMRLGPGPPEVIVGMNESDGCYSRKQRCDGILDCPSGHDEMGCPDLPQSCPDGSTQCPGKSVCIKDSMLCNGINNCGMYEDEADCCGIDGFIRCNDGRCVPGDRCDGVTECVDLSDEYHCPTPGDDATYFQCDDGQLIESRHVCDAGLGALQPYQCSDLSDETHCADGLAGLPNSDAGEATPFDHEAGCFVLRHSWSPAAAAAAANGGDDSTSRGGRRRLPAAAAGSGYASGAVIALLAATCCAAVVGSWLACLLIVLSICSSGCGCSGSSERRQGRRRRRLGRRPLAAARLLAAAAALLFLSAAAQAAAVVYWCLYVSDVNRELFRVGGGGAKPLPAVGQAFRETLLALGVELHFRSSFFLTAAGSAAHLLCVVLCLIARRHRLLELRRLRAYLDGCDSSSSGGGEERGSLFKYGVAAASAAAAQRCSQPCVLLDLKVPMPDAADDDDVLGTRDDGGGSSSSRRGSCEDVKKVTQPPVASQGGAGSDDDNNVDAWSVSDPDKCLLQASVALDSAKAPTAAAADSSGSDRCENPAAAAADVTKVAPAPLLSAGSAATLRLRRSPVQTLPCVRESECEDAAADGDYVDAARRLSDLSTTGKDNHDGESDGGGSSISSRPGSDCAAGSLWSLGLGAGGCSDSVVLEGGSDGDDRCLSVPSKTELSSLRAGSEATCGVGSTYLNGSAFSGAIAAKHQPVRTGFTAFSAAEAAAAARPVAQLSVTSSDGGHRSGDEEPDAVQKGVGCQDETDASGRRDRETEPLLAPAAAEQSRKARS